MTTNRKGEDLYARAIRFIEEHAPRDEASHKEGGWGYAFHEPISFCDGLTGPLGAAWVNAKRPFFDTPAEARTVIDQ